MEINNLVRTGLKITENEDLVLELTTPEQKKDFFGWTPEEYRWMKKPAEGGKPIFFYAMVVLFAYNAFFKSKDEMGSG